MRAALDPKIDPFTWGRESPTKVPQPKKNSMVIDLPSYEYYISSIPRKTCPINRYISSRCPCSGKSKYHSVGYIVYPLHIPFVSVYPINHRCITMFKQIPLIADKTHYYFPLIPIPIISKRYHSYITNFKSGFINHKAVSSGGCQRSIILSNHGFLLRGWHWYITNHCYIAISYHQYLPWIISSISSIMISVTLSYWYHI